jgi:hypothetical protein
MSSFLGVPLGLLLFGGVQLTTAGVLTPVVVNSTKLRSNTCPVQLSGGGLLLHATDTPTLNTGLFLFFLCWFWHSAAVMMNRPQIDTSATTLKEWFGVELAVRML